MLAQPTHHQFGLPKLLGAPVEPGARPSLRLSAWRTRRTPEDPALRIVFEAFEREVRCVRASQLRIRLSMT
jgi:hypothetical protein